MRRLFLKLSMLLFVLGMSTNVAWADMSQLSSIKNYWAQLTGVPSSEATGEGKVYVTIEDGFEPSDDDWNTWAEGVDNVKSDGRAVCAPGMVQSQVVFRAFAKADNGSYFTGWSFANNGTDLGVNQPLTLQLDPSNIQGDENEPNAKEYILYATFEPVLIDSYTISGDNTTADDGESHQVCEQTVIFSFSGKDIDANDFTAPAITPADTKWAVTAWDYNTTNAKKLTAKVKFTTASSVAAEYSANLRLTTARGISMNVPLNARTIESGIEAMLYDGKERKEATLTTLSDLLNVNVSGYKNPIIKLNANYDNAVSINKDITFDLNGYEISSTLTVSEGNVTIAYSPYGGSATALSITGGKAILNGGTFGTLTIGASGTVEQNGATITGTITNAGTMATTDGSITGQLTSSGTLTVNGGTFTNNSGVAIDITGGTAQIKKGTITGSTYGIQSAGTTTVEKLAVISGGTKAIKRTAGTTTVNCGKFTNPAKLAEGDITFISAFFKEATGVVKGKVLGKPLLYNTAGAEFRDGYNYFAGEQSVAQAAGICMCRIGAFSYTSLEDALAYANNNSEQELIIVMQNDYTMPSGYYTLPQKATLLVPMDAEQDAGAVEISRFISTSASRTDAGVETEWVKPTRFRTLTLSNGVNLDVQGIIEVSGTQYCTDESFTGTPYGPYGHLQMNKGSRMVLQDGSHLRAWGYITGDIANKTQFNVPMGEIDARRGATVHEPFQMGDWKDYNWSGRALLSNTHKIFPVSQYFIQNIEVPVKYHPGAVLSGTASVAAYIPYEQATHLPVIGGMLPQNYNINVAMSANDVKIIGVNQVDEAVFLMNNDADAENTWVRKWYDASKDQQVYEINSSAHIGSMVIPLVSAFGMDLNMNSGIFRLPITNNFKIHVLSGEMDFTQSTELLPNSEVEVDKDALVYVSTSSSASEVGSLYVYDADQWGQYALGQYASLVKYSPVFDGSPSTRDIAVVKDAAINIHGTFDTRDGYVYTTTNDEVTTGGANIFSSVEDAGTFIFTVGAKSAEDYEEIYQVNGSNVNSLTDSSPAKCVSAWLKNNNGTYVKTAGTAEGKSYCYIDMGNGGEWTMLEQRGCFTYNAANGGTYYIKPQEYVAVVVNAVWDEENGEFTSLSGNDDHTFSDAAGTGRLFINLGNPDSPSECQWWEVEQKDNYYHCIHPLNDTYYEWDDSAEEWKEVKFTITWKDWDGSTITTYSVPYGTQAEWLSTNPTREKTVDYTYSFTGWSPALGKVTSDVTYTATYQQDTIKYTIVFVKDGGVEIERHLLPRDSVPVCENVPTRTGYILQWEPGIEPVVGNQTYTATWLPEPPETYTITFKNYNGTQLEQKSVEANTTPTYTGSEFTKPATTEYTYTFAGWKPTLAPATTNATYVAQFNEVAQTYVINFYDENEETIIKTENLTYGATPTPPAVTKTNPEEGNTYTYVWKNTADASKTIETVTAAASYKPVFTGTKNKYTVTLQCNLPGKCSFTGAGIYEHNTYATISATPVDGYEFVKWQERSGDANLGSVAVTDNISLTAVVKESAKPAPGNLNLGVDADPVTISSATDYMDLSITSNGIDASSQIVNANNITLYGNADFVFKQNIKAGYWYSFAVPWRVDATSGVYLGGSSTPAVLGKDFEIIYYDGAVRAAQGKVDACWVYLKNLSTKKVLEPGRAYMIFIKHGSQSQIVFRKKVQEPLLTTTTTINQYSAASDLDANWNAIANPALYKAYMYAGADPKGFYYKSEDDLFDWYHLKDEKLVVGEAVYIQAPNAEPIVANASSYATAPRRERAEQATSFDVQIAAAGAAKRADHISVQIDENKEENKYIIGKDLTKFGVSARVAQMWINRYDVKLCFNTIAPEGEYTSFPMSIYAPKAGAYTIAIEREVATEDYNLYLTYNGEAIWNLSDGAYVANLSKGTDANYGLRISAKAPQTATGMDEAVVDSKDAAAYKVLIGNQVFIIRGEKVYSMDGQLVK